MSKINIREALHNAYVERSNATEEVGTVMVYVRCQNLAMSTNNTSLLLYAVIALSTIGTSIFIHKGLQLLFQT